MKDLSPATSELRKSNKVVGAILFNLDLVFILAWQYKRHAFCANNKTNRYSAIMLSVKYVITVIVI